MDFKSLEADLCVFATTWNLMSLMTRSSYSCSWLFFNVKFTSASILHKHVAIPIAVSHNVELASNQQENKISLANYNEDRSMGGNDVTIINIMHNQQANSSTHK